MLRRTVLAGGALLLASGLVACSTGPTATAPGTDGSGAVVSAADPGAFPVTIEHAFGATEITAEPQRIAVVGVSEADILLSLGVVPISIPKVVWGGDADGTTPWFDERLAKIGGKQPAILDQTDAVPADEVAKQTPDLILATYSGITQAEYDTLSKIAPVVAYPDQPWSTPWQESLDMVGKATGRNALADKVEAETETLFADARTKFPQIQGKTFIWSYLSTADLSQVGFYTIGDNRTGFMAQIGMRNAPYVEANSKPDEFFTSVSAERAAELESDFFFTYAEAATDAETFAKDQLIGQIPAIKAGRFWASTENVHSLAAGVPTPLSIPHAIEHFVPGIAKAIAAP